MTDEGTTDSGIDHRTTGLRHRQTLPVDAVASIDADAPPSEVWDTLVSSDGFERALVDAVRDLLADVPYYARVRTLFEAGVTAADGGYARLVAGFDRAPETDAYHVARDVTRQFGQGEVTPIGRLGFDEIAAGPLALLEAGDAVPTVAVRLDENFRERRREHRTRTCRLLARLGQVCNVALVATGLTARWLAREHGEDLPATFSERCRTGGNSDDVTAETIDTAREEFAPDGRAVRILRDVADEPGETLAYHELTAIHGDVSPARVSQLVGDLEEHGLVDRYGPRRDRRVDLLPAGRAFLDRLDAETGRQQRLDAVKRKTGQCCDSAVLSRPHGRAAPDGEAVATVEPEAGVPYRTRFLDRATHHGTAAAAAAGDIVAVEAPTPGETSEERHTRSVSYDEERDEALVAVRATTPLQYMVSVAVGLASPRLFDRALPVDRLEEIDDPPAILRDARCIGGLSSAAVDDPEVLRDRLVEWGEDLEAMTTKLRNEEYDDRNRFRGEILRSAHGLAGTIVHLLDVAGVDLVRELRVPSLPHGKLEALARTVTVATAIQSRYGAFACYRQLFENREDKRETALSPDVDAEDPLGEYIGSLVVRGPSAGRFGYHLEGALSSPADLHDDAPEFAVRVTVATPSRESYTAAVNRMLATKGIRATPEAVTLFQALAGDVYAVTEAIRWLGKEEDPRTVRLDEVRVSLAALEADRLLPDAPPSVSKAVGALLRSSRPLSREALADEAGISTRSLRRHLEALLALDLVRETEAGYRLALPFDDERGASIAPEAVTDDSVTLEDLVFEVTLALLPIDEAGRLGDPDDPLGGPFFGPGFDPGPLQVAFPDANPWFEVAKTLCNAPLSSGSAVEFGASIEQTSIQEQPAKQPAT